MVTESQPKSQACIAFFRRGGLSAIVRGDGLNPMQRVLFRNRGLPASTSKPVGKEHKAITSLALSPDGERRDSGRVRSDQLRILNGVLLADDREDLFGRWVNDQDLILDHRILVRLDRSDFTAHA